MDLSRYPAAMKAMEDAENTGAKVTIRHMDEWVPPANDPKAPRSLPSPCCHLMDRHYYIYVGDDLTEEMAVHELLHVILQEERYPTLRFDNTLKRRTSSCERSFKDVQFRTNIENSVIHYEIYRRMENVYGLVMDQYRRHVDLQLASIVQKHFDAGKFGHPIGLQAQVATALDAVALTGSSGSTARFFTQKSPKVIPVAEKVFKKIQDKGMETPQKAKLAGEVFLDEITTFGDEMGNDADNDLWRALRWELPSTSKHRAHWFS